MNTSAQTDHLVNGLDTDHVIDLATRISQNEEYGKFRFRANNQWLNGSRSRTTIQGFFAGGKEDTSRTEALTVGADQPALLAGCNTAPNAAEHFLHALASCLNTTLVYHASVQGIPLEQVDVSAEGRLNARGFFGISDDVKRGYDDIRVDMKVRSPADVATLTKLAMYSPVYEMVSKAVPVDFTLTTR